MTLRTPPAAAEPAPTTPSSQPSHKRYLIISLLIQILALPLVVQLGGSLGMYILSMIEGHLRFSSRNDIAVATVVILMILSFSLPALALGYFYGRHSKLPASFAARYLPLIAPLIYVLLVWVIAMFLGKGDVTSPRFGMIVGIAFIPYLVANFFAAFGGEMWFILLVPLASCLLFLIAFAFATWRRGCFSVSMQRSAYVAVALIALLSVVCGWQAFEHSKQLLPKNVQSKASLNEEVNLWDYRPFNGNQSTLTAPRSAPTLHIDSDYPRLDGALAFYPVYAAAVQALYENPKKTKDSTDDIGNYLQGNTSPDAYQHLIDNKVDLLFAAAPSAAQQQLARDNGLELTLTPVAKEAFVFLTNNDNPVKSLTVEQIRAIYSGEINNWRDLGGKDAAILAFQRPADSGSQSTMINKVMQGKTLRAPLEGEYMRGMGGLVRRVAGYHNDTAAIGYSFRYYATQMNKIDGIQLLSINDIAPTKANIHNDSYPFTVNVYMITARPPSANTQKLMDWFLSPQGQQLIEDAGYVPLSEAPL